MPGTTVWPTTQKVISYLKVHGYDFPDGQEWVDELAESIERAIRFVQTQTQKTYTIATGQMVEVPGSSGPCLFLPWMVAITSVVRVGMGDLREFVYGYDLSEVTVDWETLPTGDQAFRTLRLISGGVWPGYNYLQVTGDIGYCDGPPIDVARAALLYAAADSASTCPGGDAGQLKGWKGEDRDGEEYESETADHPTLWQKRALALVQPFVDPPVPRLKRPHGQPRQSLSLAFTTPR